MNKSLTLKIFLLIITNDLVDAVAQLFMKKGMNAEMGSLNLHHLFNFMVQTGSSGWVWFGIILSLLNFFLWIGVLSRIDLSTALPLSNVTYMLTPLVGMVFLHEIVTPVRWLGILLIVAGIHFISRSAQTALEPS